MRQAGFPCQSFSIAGRRGGFQDTRGTLFFEIMRLAKARKPKYLFLENVKGLLSHDGGKTFATIISTLAELGYDAEWQVLNSKDFGVPQNRERVFIVGHLRGRSRPKVFPIRGTNQKALKQLVGGSQGYRVYDAEGISCTLASEAGGMGAKTGLYLMGATTDKPGNMDTCTITDIGKETANCLAAKDYKGLRRSYNIVIQAVLTPDRAGKRQNGRRFKNDGEPMFTITAQDRHGVAIKKVGNIYGKGQNGDVYDGEGLSPTLRSGQGIVGRGIGSCNSPKILDSYHVRRLTPLECWRLQGFPDWAFQKAKEAGISDSQLYKQAGNAVTVNVIYEIALKLKEVN